jgi:hypothetical protein
VRQQPSASLGNKNPPLDILVAQLLPDLRHEFGLDPIRKNFGDFLESRDDHVTLLRVRTFDEIEEEMKKFVAASLVDVVLDGEQEEGDQFVAFRQ